MTDKFSLDDLVKDSDIYPRQQISRKTIDSYMESLKAGAEFPPIEVQEVKEDGKKKTVVLDGWHRVLAYNALNNNEDFDNVKTIEGTLWKEEVLDKEQNLEDLRIKAVQENLKHGERLKESDIEYQATRIVEDRPIRELSNINSELADKFQVTEGRISQMIGSLVRSRRASRDSIIYKLSQLGWTQEEIAEKVGLNRPRVSQIVNNFSVKEINNAYEEGKSVEEIADYHNTDIPTVLGVILRNKSDQERFDELGNKDYSWKIKPWDRWSFNGCDNRFGQEWPGWIPAQLVGHALYFFTEEEDLVFDPMAGGGVVPDVCLALNRKCRTYDAADGTKPSVKEWYWDPSDPEWPPEVRDPDLIFFDPPYYSKKEKEYKELSDEDQVPISSLDREEYLEFFRSFFSLAYDNAPSSCRLAFLNANWRPFQSTPALKEDSSEAILIPDYCSLMSEAGWKITHLIQCPYSTQRFTGNMVSAMQENRSIGAVSRCLIVGER